MQRRLNERNRLSNQLVDSRAAGCYNLWAESDTPAAGQGDQPVWGAGKSFALVRGTVLVGERVCRQFSADLHSLASMRRFVEEVAAGGQGESEAIADMVLAMNEATTNLVQHGYRGDPGTIEIEVGYEGEALVVCLRDWSPPFDPAQVADRDVSAPLEERPLGGLGITMMRQLTDGLIYRQGPEGANELILIKEGVRSS
jgi:anti-sigma regulatory factor (Ser/Thr protein kinase)